MGYVKDVTLESALATTRELRGRWEPVDTDAARDFTMRLFSGESFAVTLPAGRSVLSAAEEGTVFLLIHGKPDAAVPPEREPPGGLARPEGFDLERIDLPDLMKRV